MSKTFELQCACGKFKMQVSGLPRNSPGRCICYCDDCQAYLKHLGREDLLDENGGTEIVPVYPAETKVIVGAEHLKCTKLLPHGLHRFSTSCCGTPVANVKPGFPWAGLLLGALKVDDPAELSSQLGPIRARIMGRFAKGTPPAGTPDKVGFKETLIVFPFVAKGLLLRKWRPSPFFDNAGQPVVRPHVLSDEERAKAYAEPVGRGTAQ